jgi:uracil-DNA glycosylase family 4
LKLCGALVSAAVRCAPPGNRPLPQELDNCRAYLQRELALLPRAAVLVALGALAFDACLKALSQAGDEIPRPRPKFAHGAGYRIGGHTLLASYHPSQQNTYTGKLTRAMLRQVLKRAVRTAEKVGDPSSLPPSRNALRRTGRSSEPALSGRLSSNGKSRSFAALRMTRKEK